MLTIKNQKILDFYSANPGLDFENINLIFIDLFEKLLDEKNTEITSSINNEILSTVRNLKQNLDSITSLQNNIMDNISLKMHESRDLYLQDVKMILNNNTSETTDRLNNFIESQNSQLIDKTTLLMNEVIPSHNQVYREHIETALRGFHDSISGDTKKLLSSLENENSMDNFIKTVESKSSNFMNQIQQPIFSFISSTEERLDKNITKINESAISHQSDQKQTMTDLADYLSKFKNSSYKGQLGETQLESVLNSMFPSACINNTTGTPESCDFYVERKNQPVFLVETKKYDKNVSQDEVKKFIRDIDVQKQHGIFLSQNSGITSKQNYQIDIRGGLIMVYVHYVEYCPHKIKIAVDIIDTLHEKLDGFKKEGYNHEGLNINDEDMETINQEYGNLVDKKIAMIDLVKGFQKKMVQELEDIKFPVLSKCLSIKYGAKLNDENETIVCDICNTFVAKNNRALATHKRRCSQKDVLTIKTS